MFLLAVQLIQTVTIHYSSRVDRSACDGERRQAVEATADHFPPLTLSDEGIQPLTVFSCLHSIRLLTPADPTRQPERGVSVICCRSGDAPKSALRSDGISHKHKPSFCVSTSLKALILILQAMAQILHPSRMSGEKQTAKFVERR